MGAHLEFESVHELGKKIGIETINRGHIAGFPAESGWGIYRGEGFGHQGLVDGWLVTFAAAQSRPKLQLFSDLPSTQTGAIIAHEIIGDIRTGRCLLLIATGHRFPSRAAGGQGRRATHHRATATMVPRAKRRRQRQHRDRTAPLALSLTCIKATRNVEPPPVVVGGSLDDSALAGG